MRVVYDELDETKLALLEKHYDIQHDALNEVAEAIHLSEDEHTPLLERILEIIYLARSVCLLNPNDIQGSRAIVALMPQTEASGSIKYTLPGRTPDPRFVKGVAMLAASQSAHDAIDAARWNCAECGERIGCNHYTACFWVGEVTGQHCQQRAERAEKAQRAMTGLYSRPIETWTQAARIGFAEDALVIWEKPREGATVCPSCYAPAGQGHLPGCWAKQ